MTELTGTKQDGNADMLSVASILTLPFHSDGAGSMAEGGSMAGDGGSFPAAARKFSVPVAAVCKNFY